MSGPAVIHLHLFKNAGSTIDRVLEQHFGERWKSFDHRHPRGVVRDRDLVELVGSGNLLALSSHQINPPLPDQEALPHIPLVILRHPLARLRSVYAFDRQRGPVTPAAEIAARHPFAGYVAEMIRVRQQTVVNFHVRQLSGSRRIELETGTLPSVADALDLAREFVATLPCVGVVEDWERTRRAFADLIAAAHPGFEFPDLRENVSIGFTGTAEELRDQLCDEIGVELVAEYEERNWADLTLYREVARARSEVPRARANRRLQAIS